MNEMSVCVTVVSNSRVAPFVAFKLSTQAGNGLHWRGARHEPGSSRLGARRRAGRLSLQAKCFLSRSAAPFNTQRKQITMEVQSILQPTALRHGSEGPALHSELSPSGPRITHPKYFEVYPRSATLPVQTLEAVKQRHVPLWLSYFIELFSHPVERTAHSPFYQAVADQVRISPLFSAHSGKASPDEPNAKTVSSTHTTKQDSAIRPLR